MDIKGVIGKKRAILTLENQHELDALDHALIGSVLDTITSRRAFRSTLEFFGYLNAPEFPSEIELTKNQLGKVAGRLLIEDLTHIKNTEHRQAKLEVCSVVVQHLLAEQSSF